MTPTAARRILVEALTEAWPSVLWATLTLAVDGDAEALADLSAWAKDEATRQALPALVGRADLLPSLRVHWNGHEIHPPCAEREACWV